MAQNLTNQNANPAINVKEISDQYIRKNFQNLAAYFSNQNQLLNFKFFEVYFPSAQTSYSLQHGLGIVPQDIVMVNCVGNGQINFNLGLSTSTSLNISTTGSIRARFFVGQYWNHTSTYQYAKTDQMVFSANPSNAGAAVSTTSIAKASAAMQSIPTTVAGVSGNLQFITGNYQVQTSDDTIFCSNAALNVTLFSAKGNAGRVLSIEKTDMALANIITITDNAGFSTTLNTQGECIQIKADGTTWRILNRYIPFIVTPLGKIPFLGSVTNPIPGPTAINAFYMARRANKMWLRGLYRQTSVGTDGSGEMLITLPFNQTIDTNLVALSTAGTSAGVSTIAALSLLGGGLGWVTNGTGRGGLTGAGWDSTHIALVTTYDSGQIGWIQTGGSGYGFGTNSTVGLNFQIEVPIAGWNS